MNQRKERKKEYFLPSVECMTCPLRLVSVAFFPSEALLSRLCLFSQSSLSLSLAVLPTWVDKLGVV